MKDLQWLKEGYFAHRGLYTSTIPENSLQAFSNAVDNGYDIELDIQITKDNRLVVIHDKNLIRLCNVDINIQKTVYDDIKDYKLKGTNNTISLLNVVLDSIHPSTKLLIELKNSKKNKLMVSLFQDIISNYEFTYAVQSFDPRIVNLIKKQSVDTIRGYIVKSKPFKCRILNFLIGLFPINAIIKPDFINHKFEDLPNKKMDKLKDNGMIVLSYTARSKEDLTFIRDRYDNAVFEGFIPRIKS